MSSITEARSLSARKHGAAALLAIAGSIADIWGRAFTAQHLAEKYLSLSDSALKARGTSRSEILDRIRHIMTDIE